MHNKRSIDVGLERGHHLIVAYLPLHVMLIRECSVVFDVPFHYRVSEGVEAAANSSDRERACAGRQTFGGIEGG